MKKANSLLLLLPVLAATSSLAFAENEGHCGVAKPFDFVASLDMTPGERNHISEKEIIVYEGSLMRNVLEFSRIKNFAPILLQTGYDEFIKKRFFYELSEGEDVTGELIAEKINSSAGLLTVSYNSAMNRLEIRESRNSKATGLIEQCGLKDHIELPTNNKAPIAPLSGYTPTIERSSSFESLPSIQSEARQATSEGHPPLRQLDDNEFLGSQVESPRASTSRHTSPLNDSLLGDDEELIKRRMQNRAERMARYEQRFPESDEENNASLESIYREPPVERGVGGDELRDSATIVRQTVLPENSSIAAPIITQPVQRQATNDNLHESSKVAPANTAPVNVYQANDVPPYVFRTYEGELLTSAIDRFAIQYKLPISQESLGFDLSNMLMSDQTYKADSYIEILKMVLTGMEILISVGG